MMRSLLRGKNDDHGSMAVKPPFMPADGQSWMAGVSVSSTKAMAKGKAVAAAVKPWADQPWPLIDTPSSTQHVRISFSLSCLFTKMGTLGYRMENLRNGLSCDHPSWSWIIMKHLSLPSTAWRERILNMNSYLHITGHELPNPVTNTNAHRSPTQPSTSPMTSHTSTTPCCAVSTPYTCRPRTCAKSRT